MRNAAPDRTHRPSLPTRVLALGTGLGLMLSGAIAAPALAAPGDTSRATGQYLDGTLLGLDAGLLVSLGGEVATSNGTAVDTQSGTLDIGALGLVNLEIPGGIQVPVDFADIGVVSQYAQARADASSTGASGLINGSGGIGTGGVDQEPGPLHVNLGNVVNAVAGDVGSAFTNELANLDLRVGVTGATASQAAPAPATGDYTIADARITFTSPTVAGLSGAVRT